MIGHRYIGVDGCKAGWFFVATGPGDNVEFGVFENIEGLFKAYSDVRLILIDIPIGLPSKEIKKRGCDLEARKILGPKRASSVFPPPCRDALVAKTYSEACLINQDILGKKISQQTFNLIKKIKEVDNFLSLHFEAKNIIRETHPEICFWALSGYKPMVHRKSQSQGVDERLDLLEQHYPQANAIYKAALDRYPRKEVARDDILDALVIAITAGKLDSREATLPQIPEKDALGLSMEMVYSFPQCSPKKDHDAIGHGLPNSISKMIALSDSSQRVFPATEYYNETWMLRIVLDWFSNNNVKDHPLSFSEESRWFSEGLIPSQFLPRSRKDSLGESWTHSDAIIGHFQIGQGGRADVKLSRRATHLVCTEAKMFSKLSPGVTHARYYHQAARYVACMTELIFRADLKPGDMNQLAFCVLAPKEQIDAGVFKHQVDSKNIKEIVKRRVSEYNGEKDQWFQRWFLPTLSKMTIKCISWESIIDDITKHNPIDGKQIESFYLKCIEYNHPIRRIDISSD